MSPCCHIAGLALGPRSVQLPEPVPQMCVSAAMDFCDAFMWGFFCNNLCGHPATVLIYAGRPPSGWMRPGLEMVQILSGCECRTPGQIKTSLDVSPVAVVVACPMADCVTTGCERYFVAKALKSGCTDLTCECSRAVSYLYFDY